MAELCPKGQYTAKVIKQGLFESPKSGTLEFKLFAEVFRFEGTEISKPFRKNVTEYITDGTLKYFVPKLRNLGFTGDNLQDLVPGPEGRAEQDLTGMEITVLCNHEEYQGQLREKWGLGGSPAKLASADKIAMWSARIAAFENPQAATATNATAAFGAPTSAFSEDLPF